MKFKIKSIGMAAVLSTILLSSACSDSYLDTFPTSSVSPETMFQDVDAAKMAVNGIARLMVSQYTYYGQAFCGEGTIKFIMGEYTGDNFSRPNLASGWYNTMNGNRFDDATSAYTSFPWYYYYTLIGNANEIIYNIDNAAGSESTRKFLKAQGLVYRAFSYTQLIPLYCLRWVDSNNGTSVSKRTDGLVLRTEENKDEKFLPLVSSGEVYAQIYADLDAAIALFSESTDTRDNIWEPNINVAYAVYARAAITRQDYAKAADMAAKARVGYPLMSNADYFAGFSAPNQEWIWGSYGGSDQTLHYYGFHSYMAYDADGSTSRSYPACISKTIYDQLPVTDIRRELFLDPGNDNYNKTVGTVSTALANQVRAAHPTMSSTHNVAAYHSFKFSIGGSRGIGYINQFRSAEMYLIEAEAAYFQGNEPKAQALLNELNRDSKRNEAYNCTATGEDLLKEIKYYRAIELWGEGFSWADKKRWKEPTVRLTFAEGGNFHTTVAGVRDVTYKNGWTHVTPLIEYENNEAQTN